MPPSLQAALVPLIVMGLTSLAVKMKIDAKELTGNILAIATALAALIVAGYGWLMNRTQAKTIVTQAAKIDRAEAIAPNITSIPPGSETKATVVVNDPAVPDIKHDNPRTP